MASAILAASWLRLNQPWWLAAMAAGLIPLLLALWARRRGRNVNAFSVVLQFFAVVTAVMALSRPAVFTVAAAKMPYLVFRDVSASARTQSQPLDWPDELTRESFDFAGSIGAVDGSDARATRLGSVLRLAAARADTNKVAGVVIWTDGQFLDEDWSGAAEALGRGGGSVIIVPMDSPPADARISEFAAVRRGDGRVQLRLTVAANAMQRRTLRVWREGEADRPLLARPLKMLAGESVTIRLAVSPPAGRAAVYKAAVSPGDAFAENDSAATIVLPRRQRVALIAGEVKPTFAAAESLAVATVAPADAPQVASGWLDYAAVVLVDASGKLLGDARRAALAEYVRGGGGLVLLGAGPHKTAADRDDPLNRVAALVANPQERRPLEVIVVLDASGSMAERRRAGQTKFDVAREAVVSLRRHLTGRDG
ncbi:MAG: hypothetical protein KAU28_09185, partial [Phycisphaerae bacterium]|nr:hypothetical protein [Phycisphaerae bacterium]